MITTDGLLAALEGLTVTPVVLGLYSNEPDGDVVYRSDLEEPQNYERLMIQPGQWKIDETTYIALAEKMTFKFSGKAGKVVGYFLARGERVISYEPFADPVPVNTNEDLIHVRPRLRVRRAIPG